jgi:hypothetical protein
MRTHLPVLLLLFLPAAALAATIHVPGDQPTIQAGIDAAGVGDTVLVATGNYLEHEILMSTLGITLRSETGLPECVVIDAQGLGRVLICEQVVNPTYIEGFTITGGVAQGAPAESRGGGIYCLGSWPMIAHCRFADNYAHYGGGLYCGGSSPGVSDCDFTGNQAYTGGGTYVRDASPTFHRCRFVGNEVQTDGGAIGVSNGAPVIDYCVFTENHADWWGGVFFGQGERYPHFRNNTMVQNTSRSWGAAIFTCGFCRAILENSLIAYNDGEAAINAADAASLPDVICCDVHSNEGGDYGGALPDQTGINGNISEDPLFCDLAGGDLTLAANSPCLPEYNECQVLMGALEQGCAAPAGLTDLTSVAFRSRSVPNPGSGALAIRFNLPRPAQVDLLIFDAQGRCVRRLAAGTGCAGGLQQFIWDGRNDAGEILAPGIYVYRLEAGTHGGVGKITLVQ